MEVKQDLRTSTKGTSVLSGKNKIGRTQALLGCCFLLCSTDANSWHEAQGPRGLLRRRDLAGHPGKQPTLPHLKKKKTSIVSEKGYLILQIKCYSLCPRNRNSSGEPAPPTKNLRPDTSQEGPSWVTQQKTACCLLTARLPRRPGEEGLCEANGKGLCSPPGAQSILCPLGL